MTRDEKSRPRVSRPGAVFCYSPRAKGHEFAPLMGQ